MIIKSPNPTERSRAGIEQLNNSLRRMLVRCEKDVDYASRAAPWPRRRGDSKNIGEAVEADVAKLPAEILRLRELRVHRGKTLVRGRLSNSRRT